MNKRYIMDPKTTFRFPPRSYNSVRLTWENRDETEFTVPNMNFVPWLRFDAKRIISDIEQSNNHFSQWTWNQYSLIKEGLWYNRLIHADSLIGMTTLVNQGYSEKVQMIYCDPPFGIAYNGRLSRDQTVVEGYVDNWQQGLADYLGHLKKRFLLCHQLLHESGSFFVQIGEDNQHYVRCVLDEIFGQENCISVISFRTAISTNNVYNICDYLLWYAKDKTKIFRRPLFLDRPAEKAESTFTYSESDTDKTFKPQEIVKRISGTKKQPNIYTFTFKSQKFTPPLGFEWKWSAKEMDQLARTNRLTVINNKLYGKRYPEDFSMMLMTNVWTDTATSTFAAKKHYTVHTNPKVIRRCIAMTTKPGDLILDPTCGSGTTPWVAEEMGRRWIAFDTSPRAIMGTFSWLLGSKFPEFRWNTDHSDFLYHSLTKLSLADLAHERDSANLSLFDQPEENHQIQRIVAPFVVEIAQIPLEIKYDPYSLESQFPQLMDRSGVLLPNGQVWKIPLQSMKYLKQIHSFHLFMAIDDDTANRNYCVIGSVAGLVSYEKFSDLLKEINKIDFTSKTPQIYYFTGLISLALFQQLNHQISELGLVERFHFVWIHPEVFCEGLNFETHTDLFRICGHNHTFFNPISNTMELITNDQIAVDILFSPTDPDIPISVWLGFFEKFVDKTLKFCYSARDKTSKNLNSVVFDHQGTPHY